MQIQNIHDHCRFVGDSCLDDDKGLGFSYNLIFLFLFVRFVSPAQYTIPIECVRNCEVCMNTEYIIFLLVSPAQYLL